jgi:hypothetical protein
MRVMRGPVSRSTAFSALLASCAAAVLLASGCYGGAAPSTSPYNPPVSIGQGTQKMSPMENALTGVDQIPTPGRIPGFSMYGPGAAPVKLTRGPGGLFQSSLGLHTFGAALFRSTNFKLAAPPFKLRVHG